MHGVAYKGGALAEIYIPSTAPELWPHACDAGEVVLVDIPDIIIVQDDLTPVDVMMVVLLKEHETPMMH